MICKYKGKLRFFYQNLAKWTMFLKCVSMAYQIKGNGVLQCYCCNHEQEFHIEGNHTKNFQNGSQNTDLYIAKTVSKTENGNQNLKTTSLLEFVNTLWQWNWNKFTFKKFLLLPCQSSSYPFHSSLSSSSACIENKW